jgi:hypothetical protein
LIKGGEDVRKVDLDKIIAKINKMFGEGSICRAVDFPQEFLESFRFNTY